MAQALLASPSMFSPPYSPDDNSDSYDRSSPKLPALSSPFTWTEQDDDDDNDDEGGNFDSSFQHVTPTREQNYKVSTVALPIDVPTWVTEELEEEWVESPSNGKGGAQYENDENSSPGQTSINSVYETASITTPKVFTLQNNIKVQPALTSTTNLTQRAKSLSPSPAVRANSNAYASLNKPRIPSSLRFAINSTTALLSPKRTTEILLSEEPAKEKEPNRESPSSSAGTFVVREEKQPEVYRLDGGAEDQLKAAVRAMRGPGAGLGALLKDSAPTDQQTPQKSNDRLGLMSLFDPPSPPSLPPLLPPSTIEAPSSASFNFTPPQLEGKSWGALERLSPNRSEDNMATPIVRPAVRHVNENDETPTTKAGPPAPSPPKQRERYLRSSQMASSLQLQSSLNSTQLGKASPGRETNNIRLAPFPTTPAPQPSADFYTNENGISRTPGSAMKLFEFQYDTFTRGHLAALVEEIDELGSGGERSRTLNNDAGKEPLWEDSFIHQPSTHEHELIASEEEEVLMERSTKRIRLSSGPSSRKAVRRARANSPSLTGRHLIRSASSSSSSAVRTSQRGSSSIRRQIGDANELLNRVRANKADRPKQNATDGHPLPEPPQSRVTNDQRQELGEKLEAKPAGRLEQVPPCEEPDQKQQSPRKTLRHLSASDEVDEEIRRESAESDLMQPIANEILQDDVKFHHSRGEMGSKSRNISNNVQKSVQCSTPIAKTEALRREPEQQESATRRHFVSTPLSTRKTRRLPGGSNPLSMSMPTRSSTMSEQDEALPRSVVTTSVPAGSTSGHSRHPSLTTIGPQDVETLFASTGPSRMMFDQSRKCWIKAGRTPLAASIASFPTMLTETLAEAENEMSSSTEDDPFRDFESTRASETSRLTVADAGGLSGLGISAGTPQPVSTASPLDANYFEAPPPDTPVANATPLERHENFTKPPTEGERGSVSSTLPEADSHAPQAHLLENSLKPVDDVLLVRALKISFNELPATKSPLLVPLPGSSPATALQSSPPRQSKAVPVTAASVIPRSVLKAVIGQSKNSSPSTPGDVSESKLPRSVSFSDGKKSGKIAGVGKEDSRKRHGHRESQLKFEFRAFDNSVEVPGSLRMQDSFDEHDQDDESQEQSFSAPTEDVRDLDESVEEEESLIVLGSHSRGGNTPTKSLNGSTSRTFRRTTSMGNSFLTECSFGVSQDRLVKLITDIEPFEPHWELLRAIDLSNKHVDSLIRLKDFLPKLDEANLSNNELAFLTGIPGTLRTLLASSNKISSLTSFHHLQNLERVDISNNSIESVSHLSCLRHLRELKADYNQIRDVNGLTDIDGLLKLSLNGNLIESLEIPHGKWPQLEMLDVSRNKISNVTHLEELESLSFLNLDCNSINQVQVSSHMPRLRVLRLCDNPLSELDIAFAPKLRTLFIDSANLEVISGTEGLRKLENLSVRDQNSQALTLTMKHIRDVRRLYLSGNPIPSAFPSEMFFNLVHLELAMCQITALPNGLASVIPNVRALNLNFNFLEDLSSLTGLTRLTSLSVMGARLQKYGQVAEVLSTMTELELVDLRLNPMTLAFYPPLLKSVGVQGEAAAPPPPHADYQILDPDLYPAHHHHWPTVDKRFRRSLPDSWYFKRVAYRSVILHHSPSISILDGIECARERPKAAKVVAAMVMKKNGYGTEKIL